mgnify:CR=1 FL=1
MDTFKIMRNNIFSRYFFALFLFFVCSVSGFASDFNTTIPSLYYTQTVDGYDVITKINTVRVGKPLDVLPTSGAGTYSTVALNKYVGVSYNGSNGGLYYSYNVALPVGSHIVPINFRTKVSYDSMADMVIDMALGGHDSVSYLDSVFDFFISPADAWFFAAVGVANAVLTAAGIAVAAYQFFKKSPDTQQDVPANPALGCLGSCSSGGSPESSGTFSNGPYISERFVCYVRSSSGVKSAMSAYICMNASNKCPSPGVLNALGQCKQNVPGSKTPTTKADAKKGVSGFFKGSGGKWAKAAGAFEAAVDFVKAAVEAYNGSGDSSGPSSKNPGGGNKAPSDKDNDPNVGSPDSEAPSADDHKSQGPDKIKEKETTDTSPDGSQCTTDTTVNNYYEGDTVTTNITNNITNTDASGAVTNNYQQKQFPDLPTKQLCEAFPDIVACSKWGDEPTAEEILTKAIDVTFSPTVGDSGSCPPDKMMHLSIGDTPFSFAPVCQGAGYIKPIMITFAFVIAGFTLFGPVKD